MFYRGFEWRQQGTDIFFLYRAVFERCVFESSKLPKPDFRLRAPKTVNLCHRLPITIAHALAPIISMAGLVAFIKRGPLANGGRADGTHSSEKKAQSIFTTF